MKARWLIPLAVAAVTLGAGSLFADVPGYTKVPNPSARRSTRTYSVQPSTNVMRYSRGSRFYVPRNELFRADHKIPGLQVR